MKRIYALLFNLTLLSTNSMANPTTKIDDKYKSNKHNASLSQQRTEKIDYTIKSGDTLLAIARKYHTTRDDIRSVNSLKKGETLSIGRVLKIPINTFYTNGSIVDYHIKSGDTLLAIAQKFNSTTAEICKINKISKTTHLKLGQILKIPINSDIKNGNISKSKDVEPKIKTKIVKHKIKSGDTILGIARKYYSTTKDIIRLNKLSKKESLKLGRVLKIPVNTFYPKNRVKSYKVLADETLDSIAIKFGISKDELFLMNNLDSKILSKGMFIKVPRVKKTSKKIVEKVDTKSNLTIASVVKDGEDKANRLKKERETREKEAKLKLAIAQREVEEEAILAKAAEIRKAREIREEGRRKAKLAKEKAEREEQARLERIAKKEAEEREKIRLAKIQAEKEAREKIRLAKMKEATLERERLAQIEAQETAKLIKAKEEAQKAMDLANKKKEQQKELELAKKIAEDKAREAKKRVEALEKAVRERALKVKKQEEEIDKIKAKKETSIQINRYKSIAKKERVQAKKIAKAKPIKTKEKKIKIMSVKKSRDPSILTAKKSKLVDYKVKKGDNLYKIAKAHHTTTKEVLQSNHFRSNSDLVIGKMIKVPVDTYFHLKNYTIKRGDTLYKIARKHNTTTTRVLLANNMRRGTKLHKGSVIKVPVDTFSLQKDIKIASNGKKKVEKKKFKKLVVSKKLMHHKVKRGDTIYSIAKRNNITVKSLKLANKLKSNRDLKIGQNLRLPLNNKKNIQVKIAKKSKKTKTKKSKNRIVLNAQTGRSLDSLMRSLSSSSKRQALPRLARKHLGKRYVWGAKGPYKFDCSGFTSYVCKKNGVSIPRTSINQSKVGKYVSRSNLKAGDLIFFDTSKRRKGYVNHVGIYIGNNKFIHASSAKRRVVVTSLNKPFYKSRFKWGRRM